MMYQKKLVGIAATISLSVLSLVCTHAMASDSDSKKKTEATTTTTKNSSSVDRNDKKTNTKCPSGQHWYSAENRCASNK